MIQREPGGESVEALLESMEMGAEVQVAMSWVNWCEVLTRAQRDYLGMTAKELTTALAGVELVSFGEAAAELAAGYGMKGQSGSLFRGSGLSCPCQEQKGDRLDREQGLGALRVGRTDQTDSPLSRRSPATHQLATATLLLK